jgi:hypothetical protein
VCCRVANTLQCAGLEGEEHRRESFLKGARDDGPDVELHTALKQATFFAARRRPWGMPEGEEKRGSGHTVLCTTAGATCPMVKIRKKKAAATAALKHGSKP